ncbi:hypothetical protein [Alkalicoccobacillus murimartini]|uniref:Carboxypeptidase C (Cathepsin A) n=1 Tax=Alkalicoccobacillus murimartini TaxID=171685 RepID=A0ABT9YLQ4_9BACI|nr:hypothetical protein [Alkalicoccobacillus murimartini]MDQ0208426.1 carboxypeptidase C (cathepsin A) [Alkalicoccobacillus murimartini]
MKHSVHIFCVLIAITLVGCQTDSMNNFANESMEMNEKMPEPSTKEYLSIRDFRDTFNGQTLKNDALVITTKEDQLILSMEIVVKDELLAKLQNTPNDFWFNFADIDGNDQVREALLNIPELVEGQLLIDALDQYNNHVTITQELSLQDGLTDSQLNFLEQPENYKFQIIDENREPVNEIIGIDISTFDTL